MKIPESDDNYLEEWRTIVEAKDLHKALILHFSYLVDSPGYDRVLEGVMQEALGAEIFENKLLIDFPAEVLFARPPADSERYKEWPESFQKLVAKHEGLELDEAGLYLGDYREFGESYVREFDKTIDDSSKIRSPIGDGSNYWFYHPRNKNSNNESTLYSLTYEDTVVSDPEGRKAGSLFLSRMSEILGLYITPSTNKGNTETKN